MNMIALGAIALLTSSGMQPAASPTAPAAPQVVDTLLQCRQIADPSQRLACFDSATAAFEQARTNRDIVVVDREEVRATRRSLFGFRLPRLFGSGAEEGGTNEPTLTEINSTIASVRSAGYGRWSMTLEDGSEWTMIESDNDLDIRRGEPIKIERAAFGSYRATLRRGFIRVRRTG